MTSQEIIDRAIEVHDPNGIWQGLETLKVRLRIRGNILMSKFKSPHTRLLNVEVSTRKPWIKIDDFPKPGCRAILDGFLCKIEGDKGSQERQYQHPPKVKLFWDDLDLLFFFGYAL